MYLTSEIQLTPGCKIRAVSRQFGVWHHGIVGDYQPDGSPVRGLKARPLVRYPGKP
jgi:hypothetical protein